MARIVGGSAGGRRLAVPRGRQTRPTSERTREGLFSALEALHGTLAGVRFLDLYAGSGAIGLEAASRGAAAVLLVERDPAAIATLRANVAAVGLAGVEIRAERAERVLAAPPSAAYDVCFLDPPYADPVDTVLALLTDNGWLAATGTVVVERASRAGDVDWPPGLVTHRSRRYGDTTLWYGRRS
jgi:16S rRNA (guanine966-N2)-methyltransferase